MSMSNNHYELIALYNNVCNEISCIKSFPWKINLVHAIFNGFLIFIIIELKIRSCVECFAPFIFSSLVTSLALTFFACFLSGIYFDKLRSRKNTLAKIYDKFSLDFQEAINNKSLEKSDPGDVSSLVASILFPIFSLMILIILCVS